MPIRTLGRIPKTQFHLYHPSTTLGWRVIRMICFAEGERRVAQGKLRRVNDEVGNHIGYQLLAPAASRVDMDVPSQPSSASISLPEMRINAEQPSHTDGLSEDRRQERLASGRAAEDLAERVMRKVQVFPHVGAAKGDILKVWPRGAAEPVGAGA